MLPCFYRRFRKYLQFEEGEIWVVIHVEPMGVQKLLFGISAFVIEFLLIWRYMYPFSQASCNPHVAEDATMSKHTQAVEWRMTTAEQIILTQWRFLSTHYSTWDSGFEILIHTSIPIIWIFMHEDTKDTGRTSWCTYVILHVHSSP